MQLGMFNLMTLVDNPRGVDGVLADTQAMVLAAEQAGFDIAFFAEHHFTSYSLGVSPLLTAAALAGLDILEQEPERTRRPLALARRLTRALDLPLAQSAVVPLIVGEARRALALSDALADRGFLVAAIRPPTVAPGQARLRITLSAAHSEAEVDRLADSLHALMRVVA